MSKPLVSIIIPTHNYAQYLPDAIDSALDQTYKNIEVIVVDDGSTDDTAAVVRRYKKRLRYYYKTNGGVSSARNAGIAHAKGEYVAFLDADDILDTEYVRKTLDLLLRQPRQVGYIYTQLQKFEAMSEVTQYPGYKGSYLTVSNYISASCLIRADIARKYQYDTRLVLYEDWDYYLTLLEQGITGALVNEPLVYYRKHGNGKSALDTVDAKTRLRSYHIIRTKHRKLYGMTQTALYLAWYLARRCGIVSGIKP